ncbi:IS200/IS605 family transposase [Bifidobacterium callitrichidarum]|uniref:IS200/IS605 family transposase n=1 Tax=Bifidobacterium callitrichidarum TaxID=2052941 RepID=A0A2U2NCH6_9BIFI|nr:IS200/IS605 family transposase [Bifidobacterium callitrichidarum]PWG66790.1 IS200/IS605 family transposase [Bifidobacterium callitrichidarum]
MDKNNEIRKGRHCLYDLKAHLVFVTKYRYNVFTDEHLKRMEKIMRDVCSDFGCELVEFNGETDHVHLIVSYPPTTQLSTLINSLKGVSSRLLRKEYPDLRKRYWNNTKLWSPSYYAGSYGGTTTEQIKQYAQNQNRPH